MKKIGKRKTTKKNRNLPVGVSMAKTKNGKNRINIWLPPELRKTLNAYCVELIKRKGEPIANIKNRLTQLALKEFLENHKNDFDIQL
jgi:hypothetical protein